MSKEKVRKLEEYKEVLNGLYDQMHDELVNNRFKDINVIENVITPLLTRRNLKLDELVDQVGENVDFEIYGDILNEQGNEIGWLMLYYVKDKQGNKFITSLDVETDDAQRYVNEDWPAF